MLIREVVARHLRTDGTVWVAAERNAFPDLERVSISQDAGEGMACGDADLLLLDVGDGSNISMPVPVASGTRVVLLITAEPLELKVGAVIDAIISNGLQFVEAIALLGLPPYRVALVTDCAPQPVAPRSFLTGDQTGTMDTAHLTRIVTEWGVTNLVERAREVREGERAAAAADTIAGLQDQIRALEAELATERRQSADVSRRLAMLEESRTVAVGRAVAAAAHHPVKGVVQLPRDLVRSRRAGKDPDTAT
jgi:hypothetical protein